MTKNVDDVLGSNAQASLQSYVRRALRLEEEKDALVEDLGELYKEAKGEGFDPAILRKVVAREKKRAKTNEQDALIELYEGAIQGELFSSDDTKITISVAGGPEIETTGAGLQRAADDMRNAR